MGTKTKGKAAKKKRPPKALMSAAAATAHAANTGKEFFKSLPKGTWIECDWDPAQQIYDNCHEVPASAVPRAWGGDGP
jgi:hypothetical protein